MSATDRTDAQLLESYGRLFGASRLAHLKAVGLDRIEAKREGPYVYDSKGQAYIDGISGGGIFNLGRKHPEVTAELRRAMRETDQGNFAMISREKAALAELLAAFIPGDPECSVFSVVRGEAFDFACKLARGYTGRRELVALKGSWFGETGFAMSLSERADKEDFVPLVPETHRIPFGNRDAARRAITTQTAALFVEPVQAENQCRMPDRRYMSELRRLCTEAGALLVVDETQTGLGRTGKRFGYEHFDIEPDVVILGEALGAGVFPICATVFTQQINTFMNDHPLIHLSTFGGSDLGCRVARKALEVYLETTPWINAARLGEALKTGIENLIEKGDAIYSVEGAGLLLALDLKTPERAEAFCRRSAEAGVLIVPGLVAKDTVVVRPSLTITAKDVQRMVQAFATAQEGLTD